MNCLPGYGLLRDDGPGASLQIIASELRARGLDVRKFSDGIQVVVIMVDNAQDRGQGRVSVRYDGQVTWEYGGDIENRAGIEKTTDMIAGLLASNAPQPGGTVAS
jgi:hypothetical protein